VERKKKKKSLSIFIRKNIGKKHLEKLTYHNRFSSLGTGYDGRW